MDKVNKETRDLINNIIIITKDVETYNKEKNIDKLANRQEGFNDCLYAINSFLEKIDNINDIKEEAFVKALCIDLQKNSYTFYIKLIKENLIRITQKGGNNG
ncbi:MAG: hypothetical protein ACTSQE_16275 [Candidatus Heimdallarchaeaceae archaeon]